MPVAVETDIDLPDKLSVVEVALVSKGVSFAAFVIDLRLGDDKIADIKSHGYGSRYRHLLSDPKCTYIARACRRGPRNRRCSGSRAP